MEPACKALPPDADLPDGLCPSSARRGPGIDDRDWHPREVAFIARHQREPLDDSGRRDQGVDFRLRIGNVQRGAALGDFEVDVQETPAKPGLERPFLPRANDYGL